MVKEWKIKNQVVFKIINGSYKNEKYFSSKERNK
jgi:hypothetical protein